MDKIIGKQGGVFYGASLAMAAMVAGLLVVLLWSSLPARADTTFTVTSAADTAGSTCDSGPAAECTLRQAINAANVARGQDTIVFDLGPSATINLRSPPPFATDSAGLTVDGGNADITVSGGGQVTVFGVVNGGELALRNLTVSDGKSTNLSFSGGGALNIGGTLSVSNSTFQNNSAGDGPGDGGGGIENVNGTVEVTNSTFKGNTATDGGGGIESSGPLEVSSSTFQGNSAGAGFGGGINSTGPLEVSNSTFQGNTATDGGGGIASFSTLEVNFSTFSGNRSVNGNGHDIDNESDGGVTLSSTVLASTSLPGGNCAGKINDGGYNIDKTTSCGLTAQSSRSLTDPRLDPRGLRNNGGPTQTIALVPGSPALDRIPPVAEGCGTDVKTDQRGVSRPQNPLCDIGAFELASGLGGTERCTIEGTAGPDALIGTRGDDVICGRGGHDVLIGRGGDDTLRGGKGRDVLLGVDGARSNDALDGGKERDVCEGDRGDERANCEVGS